MNADHSGQWKKRPALEWVIGAVSAALVLAMIGYLAFEAVSGGDRPADLAAMVERLEDTESGTIVLVAVRNRGDRAAANVGVRAHVSGGDTNMTVKELRFDFVAPNATRRGAFFVEGKAVRPEVRLTVDGMVDP